MLKTILNWFSGGLLDKLLGFVERREAAQLAAMNDQQRRAHEDRQEARKAATAVRLATAAHWEQRLLTFLIAFPFVMHLWLVGWDTMWPQPWSVEKWPPPFDEWEGAILLSYFGVIGLTMSARAVAGAVAVRNLGGR
ncbi:hypothetical protein [Devosia sp.]|uniref:hypothetical protein n=1 Tax=Devosia sp. TaxID=1871048 RepID=UPI001AD09FE5|nr:hypothetical protein [Devosia sp.]MBN9335787.1 hypothetical protein [Devosia sp.]